MAASLAKPTQHQPIHHRPATARSTASRSLVALALLIATLALVAAAAGLFWPGSDSLSTVTSARGETVELYGTGLYRYDSVFKAGANLGADAVVLALGIPLLIVATLLSRRGSLRGHLLLLGTLVYFLYVYASHALATAYNELFLVYVTLVSASLFAVVLAVRGTALPVLASRFSPGLPRRGPGAFMLVSGAVTFLAWLVPLVGAIARGETPGLLGHSTTLVTEVLDLGIIVPVTFLAGVLILRREPLGYLLALALLVLEIMLAPVIAAQTAFQLAAGLPFSAGAIIGMIGSFMAIALTAIWVLVTLLRHISNGPPGPDTHEGSAAR